MHNVDLHCHSRVSDGLLAPTDLVQRARAKGVSILALTDHDTTGGLAEAADAAEGSELRFVPGVEISVTWNATTIHVVGLGVSTTNQALECGLQRVREGRARRGVRIAQSLADAGIPGGLEGALRYAPDTDSVSRAHFARFLVERHYASSLSKAFKNYLVSGKPGFVSHQWAGLSDAINWIHDAGGIGVLAHPARYRLARSELRRLLGEFVDCGGLAIEVVTGNHSREDCAQFSALAREFGLLASRGSDFHGPGESRIELGALAQLPHDLDPVWNAL